VLPIHRGGTDPEPIGFGNIRDGEVGEPSSTFPGVEVVAGMVHDA
jgi:hypothetical protein